MPQQGKNVEGRFKTEEESLIHDLVEKGKQNFLSAKAKDEKTSWKFGNEMIDNSVNRCKNYEFWMSIVEFALERLNIQGGHAFTLLVNKMRNSFTVPDFSFVKVWKGVDVFTTERTVIQTHHNTFLE